ncbi:MAG TPA: hypothetical protein QF802_03495 [Candidatus Thalassarchaeaceae archaeon]|nr:hypothetical protein [Candidatus Thalassarchaeaceae archaeon]HJM19501.1 hypothetical protein [Candidatus Thalassarchaeaceae archaeon]
MLGRGYRSYAVDAKHPLSIPSLSSQSAVSSHFQIGNQVIYYNYYITQLISHSH